MRALPRADRGGADVEKRNEQGSRRPRCLGEFEVRESTRNINRPVPAAMAAGCIPEKARPARLMEEESMSQRRGGVLKKYRKAELSKNPPCSSGEKRANAGIRAE